MYTKRQKPFKHQAGADGKPISGGGPPGQQGPDTSKEQFFELHSELIELAPTLIKLKVEATPFRDGLARLGVTHVKLILNEWVEKLGWPTDSRFN